MFSKKNPHSVQRFAAPGNSITVTPEYHFLINFLKNTRGKTLN